MNGSCRIGVAAAVAGAVRVARFEAVRPATAAVEARPAFRTVLREVSMHRPFPVRAAND